MTFGGVWQFFTLGDFSDQKFTIEEVKRQWTCKSHCGTRGGLCSWGWVYVSLCIVFLMFFHSYGLLPQFTKAGKNYQEASNNIQEMTAWIQKPVVQPFRSVLQSFTDFFPFFFTIFYEAVEMAGNFGAGYPGGLHRGPRLWFLGGRH